MIRLLHRVTAVDASRNPDLVHAMQPVNRLTQTGHAWRRRSVTLAAGAGKPSWAENRSMVGASRQNSDSLSAATAVLVRYVAAVTPLETCANPVVGNVAGVPIAKLLADNVVHCPSSAVPACRTRESHAGSLRATRRCSRRRSPPQSADRSIR